PGYGCLGRRDRHCPDPVVVAPLPPPGPPLAEVGLPGSSFWQAFWAAWNTGELGSVPRLLSSLRLARPPEKVGSGNFGTPCERMQAENLSACACIFALCAGLTGGPVGASLRQVRSAALNVAESGSI